MNSLYGWNLSQIPGCRISYPEDSEFKGCETCESEKFFRKAKAENPKEFYCESCGFCCRTCTESSICDSCYNHCLMKDNKCAVCKSGNNPNCETCSAPEVCSKCEEDYFLDKISSKCAACKSSKNPNCKTCSAPEVCSECMADFFLDKNSSRCVACPLNCRSCLSPDTCQICKERFYLDKVSSKCFICPKNCRVCFTSDTCQECALGNWDAKKLECIEPFPWVGIIGVIVVLAVIIFSCWGLFKCIIWMRDKGWWPEEERPRKIVRRNSNGSVISDDEPGYSNTDW